jgi:uncharacterized protein YehS (DUF1456 family)
MAINSCQSNTPLRIQGSCVTNNDIMRRLRYSFNFNDNKMIALFALADLTVTREQISQWLKKDDDPAFVNLPDMQFASFLNGLINEKRGKKDGVQPIAEKRLTNNIILKKLKIALNFQADDIIALLSSVGFRLSEAELSALFRKADHKHYRECKDQLMRNFLAAIQQKFRPSPTDIAQTKPQHNTVANSDRAQNASSSSSATPKKQESAPLANKPAKVVKPNASKRYVNPNATPKAKSSSAKKTLKLQAKDIWKDAE